MIIARARFPAWFAGAFAVMLAAVAVSMGVGSFPVAASDVVRVLWAALTGGDANVAENVRAVVLQVRGPRVLAALAVGAALASAGAAYQNMFRNPLVSPDILGVSGGCALGAVTGILFSLPIAAIQGLSFAGGLAAVGLVLAIGTWVRGHDRVLTLVLTGVVVGSLFGAGIAFAKYVADPYNQLPAITFWLLGSFSGVLPRDLAYALPLIVVGFVPLVLLRWRINLLSLPDDEAKALGVDVGKLRLVIIVAATLVTSAGVAIAGVIGWVGLVVPHAARLLVGAEFARVLPVSAVLGGAFMLLVDTLCRTVARTELPPGVITALVGTPVFILLLAATFPPPAMTLAAHALDFGYPGRAIGRGLDMTLEDGEVLCVLGPNGTGKTTLFRTLLGLLPALGGRVSAGGREMASLTRAQIAREVAYVPQASSSYFDFSLAEMVEMGRTAHLGPFARPGARDRDLARAALERMGIAALADRPVGAVSGGERQLALIARALATEARSMVLDEPTANLDFGNQSRVLAEVARLRASGIAVLLCTHDPDHALQVADRALLLRDGQVLALGKADDVLTGANLSALYGIDVKVSAIEVNGTPRRVCVPSLG